MNKKVIVYSTPTCHYCTLAKDYLKEKKIIFEEIDLSKNQNLARELAKTTGQLGVPIIKIDEKFVLGFDQQQIDSLL